MASKAQMDALKALGLSAAQIKALGALIPAGAETTSPDKVPYLSCWNVSAIKPDKAGQFTHTSKRGGARRYRTLTRDEAVTLMDENYAAGRTYAVSVS